MPLLQCNLNSSEYIGSRYIHSLRNGIRESNYCANDIIGKKNGCDLHVGGPLQLLSSGSNTAEIVGILITAETKACSTSHPIIYARVASHIDWIESIVWPNDEVAEPDYL